MSEHWSAAAKRDYLATLRWVNSIREENGKQPLKKLPMGVPNKPCHCPIANATGWSVTDHSIYSKAGDRIRLPGRVKKFVQRFDEGQYPGLEKEIADV